MGEQPQGVGIGGLPKRWAVIVQVVGTFGLAVFLVLYYVLVMYPKETERYERLRTSVERMIEVIEKQQSLLTRDQASRLEDLYVLAVSQVLSDRILEGIARHASRETLARELEDVMMIHTDYLRGLTRKDGGALSEMLAHKIRNFRIADYFAQQALTEWKDWERAKIAATCQRELSRALHVQRLAK